MFFVFAGHFLTLVTTFWDDKIQFYLMDSLEEKDILLHDTIINYGNSWTLED